MDINRETHNPRAFRRQRGPWLGVIATLLLIGVIAPGAVAKGIGLDKGFGDHGRVLTKIPGKGFFTTRTTIDGADRILVLDRLGDRSELLRYLPSGELDPSFGSAGRVTIALDPSVYVSDVAVDSQDRVIVAGGNSYLEGVTPMTYVVRYRVDGGLDSSFGHGGVATSSHPFGAEMIAIDSADRITVLGDPPPPQVDELKVDPQSVGKFLVRFDASGNEDTAFRDNSPALDFMSPTNFHDFTVDPAGKIVIVGEELPGDPEDESIHYHALVMQLLPDGQLDPSFSGDGRTALKLRRFADSAGGVAIDPQGRILLSASSDYTVARLRDDGAIDPSFGDRGRARFAPFASGPSSGPAGIVIDHRGRPIIAGTAGRYGSDGRLKKYFGFVGTTPGGRTDPLLGRGLRKISFGQTKCQSSCQSSRHRNLAGGAPLIDSAGRLLLVGAAKRGNRHYVALARVHLP
jgi:uncharacterized delta-60 repeat protein